MAKWVVLRNFADTLDSIFQSLASSARTYTLQDRDGVLADDTDIAACLQSANDLSDVASSLTSRINIGAEAKLFTVVDKSSSFSPALADIQGIKKMFRLTNAHTVTFNQDSTDSIPVGETVYFLTMTGLTTTIAAGSGATVETSSGGSTVVCSASAGFFFWSATKRAANTWSVQNGSPNTLVIYDTITLAGGHGVTLTNQGSGLGDIASVTRYRFKYDASWATKVRLMLNVSTGSASVNNPRIFLQYSTDNTNWTTIGDGSTAPSDVCSLTNIDIVYTSFLTLDLAARAANIYFRPVSQGGDGAADPAFGVMAVTFTNA